MTTTLGLAGLGSLGTEVAHLGAHRTTAFLVHAGLSETMSVSAHEVLLSSVSFSRADLAVIVGVYYSGSSNRGLRSNRSGLLSENRHRSCKHDEDGFLHNVMFDLWLKVSVFLPYTRENETHHKNSTHKYIFFYFFCYICYFVQFSVEK